MKDGVLLVKDELGTQWYLKKEKDDPVYNRVIQPLLKAGFELQDIVLPFELPRTLSVDNPDFTEAREEFELHGDTDKFRRLVTVNVIRRVIEEWYATPSTP